MDDTDRENVVLLDGEPHYVSPEFQRQILETVED